MKFEEYLETLPKNLLSGEDVQLPEKSFREIFKFSNLGKDDIFFHLGCGNEKGIEIAINEFKVKKAIGIDNNLEKIQNAQKTLEKKSMDVKRNSFVKILKNQTYFRCYCDFILVYR